MIKFPRVHIATSVVNRILAIAEGMDSLPSTGIPSTPEPLAEGDALDKALNTPPPPASADAETTKEIVLADLLK